MRPFRPLIAILTGVLLLPLAPIEARTRKGDKFLAQGKASELRGELDKALEFEENALSEDPSDPLYQLEIRRTRFNAAAKHLKTGQKIRSEGNLTEALTEFNRAYAIDPASPIAQQEIRRTKAMMERERKRDAQPQDPTAPPPDPEDRGLTPAQAARKATAQRIESLQSIPELKPLNTQPINLKMNNQKPRVLFETVGKLAGINVLFDPDYEQQNTVRTQSIELQNSTLDQSLDYLSLLTKSFWKPLSGNAIFVTLDNTTKRRELEEQVVKVFYLSNIISTTELQEIITTLRTVTDIQKIYNYTTQNALIIRCEADRMLLAEKIIADLDKPKSEVVVDVIVMEVRKDRVRNLGAQIANGGLSVNGLFTPRSSLQNGSVTTPTNNPIGTPITTPTNSTSSAIPLNKLKKISSGDFSITGIPGGFIEALLSDTGTRVVQSPQLRALDNVKVSLHIGDKVPTASGSFGSGIGGVGVGVSPLVQTQFTYIETGVNMDMLPRVHDSNQVTLHIEIDISQVTGYRDVGGIQQPIISQRKINQDIRTEDGEINLLGGLMQEQDSKVVQGLPGLSQIPLLRRLFSDEKIEKSQTELLITLIPHIVRAPDVTDANMRGVASGNATNVRVLRAPAAVPVAPAAAPISAPIASPGITPAVSFPPAGATAPAGAITAPAAPAFNPAPAATGPLLVSFFPAQMDATLSGAATVTLRVANITDLNALTAQLKFDPKILRINNVVAGDLIQQTGPPLNPSRNILNDTGDATITIARDPKGPGVSGSGGLVTITFQAVGRGTTTVTLPQLTLKNTPGQPVVTNTPVLNVTVK